MSACAAGTLLAVALGAPPEDLRQVLELRLPPLADGAAAPADRLDDWVSAAGVGLPDVESLAELTRIGGFDGVALWIAREQLGGDVLPDEPRLVTPERVAADVGDHAPFFHLVRALEQELAGRDVALALGRANTDEPIDSIYQQIHWPDHAPSVRLRRPGLLRLHWFDLGFAAEQLESAGPRTSLDASAVSALPADRRLGQLALDAAAFAAARRWDGRRAEVHAARAVRTLWRTRPEWFPGLPAARAERDVLGLALVTQSGLLSRVARHLGGSEPHRLVAGANLWLGERRSRGTAEVFRRPPAALDLLEWTLGETPNGPRSAATLRFPTEESLDEAPPALGGVLPADERRALRRFFSARSLAAARMRDYLFEGRLEDRGEALRQVEVAAEAALAIDAERRPRLAAEHDEAGAYANLVPLRILRQEWRVFEVRGRRRTPIATTETFVVDDGRFGDWPERVREGLGGDRIDLSAFLSGGAEGTWVLEASIPSAESRNARLRLAADAMMDVELNGAVLVEDYDARDTERGRLTVTLPLAAARNVLRVHVHCQDPVDTVYADLVPLSRPFEGLHLGPTQAREVFEPVRALEHPLALGDRVLVIPDRPRSTEAVSGSVEYTLDPTRSRRVDVWIHGIAPVGRTGELLLEVDAAPAQSLVLPPGGGWSWVRSPAPVHLEPGVRKLRLRFRERGVMVDSLSVLESGTLFPTAPRGDGPLHESSWRYDPLGQGQRVDLGGVRSTDGPRVFTPSKTKGYRVFVWMKGDRPLRRSEQCEIELSSSGHTWRFSLPAGTAVEEWVALGRLNFQAEDPVLLRARGDGHPTFLCFVP